MTYVAADPSTLGPRRARRLTRDAIARSALAVGFERLTVEAVAEQLGVTHSTLYHHIRNRDELATLAFGRLITTARWPSPSPDWRTFLTDQAVGLWQILERHPGLAREIALQVDPGPQVYEHGDRVTAHFVSLGFAPDHADLILDTVIDLTFDVAIRSQYLAKAGALNSGPTPTEWFHRKLELVLDGVEHQLSRRASARGSRSTRLGDGHSRD